MADWEKVILEWAEGYLRHRDLVLNRMRDMKIERGRIVIANKDGSTEVATALPELSKMDIDSVKLPTIFVTLNRKENLKFLTDSWKAISAVKEISIIFINPDSELETKWIIRPYVHSRVCDDSSLKIGLKSMFETVDEIA
jgi:hypothetical protein